jgi:hypothetical protein
VVQQPSRDELRDRIVWLEQQLSTAHAETAAARREIVGLQAARDVALRLSVWGGLRRGQQAG